MAKVQVHCETEGDWFSALIDDTELTFSGSAQKGDATGTPDDGEHYFYFFTSGPPGSAYSAKITSPPESAFGLEGTIGPAMKAARHVSFHVGGALATAVAKKGKGI